MMAVKNDALAGIGVELHADDSGRLAALMLWIRGPAPWALEEVSSASCWTNQHLEHFEAVQQAEIRMHLGWLLICSGISCI